MQNEWWCCTNVCVLLARISYTKIVFLDRPAFTVLVSLMSICHRIYMSFGPIIWQKGALSSNFMIRSLPSMWSSVVDRFESFCTHVRGRLLPRNPCLGIVSVHTFQRTVQTFMPCQQARDRSTLTYLLLVFHMHLVMIPLDLEPWNVFNFPLM